MLISLDKQYTTRDGERVELIRIDDIGLHPAIGTIVGTTTQMSWTRDGAYVHEGEEHHYDLVEVKQKMKITLDKKYTTVNNKEVRIYAIDGISPYCVHGAILTDQGWEEETWNLSGKARYDDYKHDLKENQ